MLPVWTHASKSYSRYEKQWWIYEEVRWSDITVDFKQTQTTAIAKNSEIKICCLNQQTTRSSNVRERERTHTLRDKGHKARSQVKYQGFWEDREWMSTGREREGSAKSAHSVYVQPAGSQCGRAHPQSRLQRKKLVFFCGSEILTPWLLCGVLPSCKFDQKKPPKKNSSPLWQFSLVLMLTPLWQIHLNNILCYCI